MLTKPMMDMFLKEYWTQLQQDTNALENHPFLGMCPKDTDGGGEYVVIPLDVDDGAEGSPNFAVAQQIAAATSSIKNQFMVQWTEDFQLAQISNQIIRLSRNVPKLALESAKRETKRARRILANRLARCLYRSGYGEKGTLDGVTGVATATATLANRADIRNFHIGDAITFSATLGSALRDGGDFVSVIGIDYDNHSLLTDAPVSLAASIAGIGAGDTIYGLGQRLAGALPATQQLQGLASWIPTVAPVLGVPFCGVDRAVWTDRYAGLRYTTGVGPVDEILIDALIFAAQNESYPTHLFICGSKWGELIKSLEGRYEKVIEQAWEAKVGYRGIQIGVGYGANDIKIFPDPDCPDGLAYAVKMSSCKLVSAGELIQNDLQGQEVVQMGAASAIEYRYVTTAAFGIDAPKHNMVIVLP